MTCAIIKQDGKTLIVQRSENMKLPLKWEFPGGKIEIGETEAKCLMREIHEELNIVIELHTRLTPSIHKYPDFTIELIPYLCTFKKGVIKLLEHKKYVWLSANELQGLDWAEADIPILKEYLNL